ncbi:hypothetical protein NDR87_07510 [Nocardia sp. CDC159]|uniref:Low molecular weight antigen MTB12-like C-terminal domain-containing protein n=1 Tax=Nocardia pulmonis TaxID=2951408 RepID=A0A9X2E460_9NOCA|nr:MULTISPECIES: hypothetical protein [Nocardia]MCM6773315.1 hypothetical protein [Nocardia pulmonis]MCM6786202.1 hypothetical protein [Nocardia sp. CDC159]
MTGRIAVATLAVVAALGMSACGSGDKKGDDKKPAATTSQTAAASPNTPPVPTAAELNQQLAQVLDPNVPDAQKVQYLEDGEQALQKDPDMIKKLVTAYQQNNAKIEVIDVRQLLDQLTAQVNFSVNGAAPTPADVPFVAQDGKWKLQKSWACAGLQNLGQTSPACS